jgi:hypothetical protein
VAVDTSHIDALWGDEEASGVHVRPAAPQPSPSAEALAVELVAVVRAQRAARHREKEIRHALGEAMEAADVDRIDVPGGFVVVVPDRVRADGTDLVIVGAGGLRVHLRAGGDDS